jgi:hypothetical protein
MAKIVLKCSCVGFHLNEGVQYNVFIKITFTVCAADAASWVQIISCKEHLKANRIADVSYVLRVKVIIVPVSRK